MKGFNKIALIGLIISSFPGYSQMIGNQAYGNYYGQNRANIQHKQSVRTTDSTLVITSSILMNEIPDLYMVTLGVSQEAENVKDCNTQINKRINDLKKALIPLGISEKDCYVDFISQTKIYDYKIESSKAEQFEKGFEMKKNVIIRLKNLKDFDKLVELSSEEEIYDIVKIDYLNSDLSGVYDKMYGESLKIIEGRKNLYVQSIKQKLNGKYRLVSDNFYSVHPKSQYKQYQAYETSDLSIYTKNYTPNFIKKEERKARTFYYDGLDASGFDKVINASEPQVGIQYVLSLVMVYEIAR